ncbi:MAG: M20/M25/M40 family metallo-hydrolase [bacterium]|nr:M20/M25/M40 family metallo-hydrolase [bacterium]
MKSAKFFLILLLTAAAAGAGDAGSASGRRPVFELAGGEAFDPAAIVPYAGDHPEIYAHVDAHLDAHLENLRRWVRQRSISAQDDGIREMAAMLRDDLEALGFAEAKLVPTSGHPGVWGFYDAGAEKTLMIYLMYDVQPVNPEDWTTPPFAGNLVENDLGKVLMARGASNQKGPERAFLNALESIRAVEGTLPVNLMVLAEGEEEIGSPHYPQLVDQFEDRLKTADGVFFPFNSQTPSGELTIYLGVKGLLYFEMEVTGGAWGGPTRSEIHGSYKSIVDAPVLRLVQALASMTTPDGNTILVPGYYDDIRPPTAEEERLIRGALGKWDGKSLRQLLGVERWIDGLSERDAVMRHFYELTLNVDGIWGGYTGEGVKTILPHQATAKVDSRLPPGVDPGRSLELVRAHLDAHGFTDVTLRRLSGYPAAQTSVEAPLVQAALSVFNKWGKTGAVWPRLAGSVPFYLFTDRLGLPLVFNGLGHGSGAHAPDEYMVVEPTAGSGVSGLAEIEKGYVDLLYALAGK